MKVTLKEIDKWCKKGPLRKLHNFIVWLAQSTQRLHHFLDFSYNHCIPRDNTTRWNLRFLMLQVAYNLQEAIKEFLVEYRTLEIRQDRLTDGKQATIKKIKDFLEKLSMATKAYESRHSTLDLILLSMDYILSQFEKIKETYESDVIIALMFNLGWAKIDKYYRLSDNTPVYIAAIILYLSRKWRYF